MNIRARKIRKNKLKNRKAVTKVNALKIKAEAKKLFELMLDMFEENNTLDEIKTYFFTSDYEFYIEDNYICRYFDNKVIIKFVKMFKAERGYNCKLDYYSELTKVVIRIK